MSKVYKGFAYRQNDGDSTPWLISFVARAEDLRSWAGIPRRSEQGLVGFQRADEQRRVEKAQGFFEHPFNQSPTSIVVGIHPAREDARRRVVLEFDKGEVGPIRTCRLIVSDDGEAPLGRVVDLIREQIDVRLAVDADGDAAHGDDGSRIGRGEGDDEEIEEDEGEAAESASAETEGEADEVGGSEELELGRSLLQDLKDRLDDEAWCVAHEDDLRDLAKPATIIDGQHRIKGAELCERGIPFSVCAIYDCAWSEQVFQFTVVNYTAQGIPDQFITANAALSLTAGELGGLQRRLIQAGVKVIEYELMRVVNFDQQSPFHQLVNLTTRKRDDKIGYRTMVGVGKGWFTGRNPAVAQIIAHIYPDVKGNKNHARAERLKRWKDSEWAFFFKDFWTVVYDQYRGAIGREGQPLWTVGRSNLLLSVVLAELQEAFLTNLAAQDESFFETNSEDAISEMRRKVKSRAEKFISYFDEDLFGRHWELKSLNVGPGRLTLRSTFRSIVDTKGNFKYGNSSLVTGKTS